MFVKGIIDNKDKIAEALKDLAFNDMQMNVNGNLAYNGINPSFAGAGMKNIKHFKTPFIVNINNPNIYDNKGVDIIADRLKNKLSLYITGRRG